MSTVVCSISGHFKSDHDLVSGNNLAFLYQCLMAVSLAIRTSREFAGCISAC